MTKVRGPSSSHNAVARCAALIGYAACGKAIGKGEWTIRKFSDPDCGRKISVEDALALDRRCAELAGERPFAIMWRANSVSSEEAESASSFQLFADLVQSQGFAAARMAAALSPEATASTRRAATASLEALMVDAARCLAVLKSDEGNVHER